MKYSPRWSRPRLNSARRGRDPRRDSILSGRSDGTSSACARRPYPPPTAAGDVNAMSIGIRARGRDKPPSTNGLSPPCDSQEVRPGPPRTSRWLQVLLTG